jgi:hypothetical protein
MQRTRIVFCGPSRAGKDEACNWLASHTPLVFRGSTSHYLAELVAPRIGVAVETLRGPERHNYREEMFRIGNELRDGQPGYLIQAALDDGADLLCGLRDPREIDWAREHDVIDLFVWVNRDVPYDPTMRLYGPEKCDIRIDNYGTLDEYYGRLRQLAKFAGIPLVRDRDPVLEY